MSGRGIAATAFIGCVIAFAASTILNVVYREDPRWIFPAIHLAGAVYAWTWFMEPDGPEEDE